MGRARIPHRSFRDIEHKRCANSAHFGPCPCGHSFEGRDDNFRYLPLDCFSPNREKVDGLHPYCKRCNNASSTVRRVQRLKDQTDHQDSAMEAGPSHPPGKPSPTSSDGPSGPFNFLS